MIRVPRRLDLAVRSPVLILTSLLTVILPLLALTPAAAAGTRAITWAPCAEDATAECGTLTVPVDWNNPRGETFQLAVARRKATDPGARIGSLVINPGGPGGSGVTAVLRGADRFTPEVTRRFDVVGFDPRGVARSHPIQCSLELFRQAPDPFSIGGRADFEALLAHNERYRQDCRARTGPLFDHVDTGSTDDGRERRGAAPAPRRSGPVERSKVTVREVYLSDVYEPRPRASRPAPVRRAEGVTTPMTTGPVISRPSAHAGPAPR